MHLLRAAECVVSSCEIATFIIIVITIIYEESSKYSLSAPEQKFHIYVILVSHNAVAI
jgi:hypothetical protein